MVFVGPPGTGKSQALKEASLQPLHDLQDERDLPNTIIGKCTSAALVKRVADNEKAFVELFEVINKLLKSDKDNATGDAQTSCELFSGESSSYRYATERTCEIPPNVPFSILGSTQVPYAARLLCRMDQGHGLLDRFTFIFPVCLRPSTAKTETARSWLESDEVCLKQLSDIFIEMHDALTTTPASFRFSPEATQALLSLKDDFIKEIN